MCGIVGYIGDKAIDGLLLKALSRLEYRGYDSAGIASVHGKTLSLLKESGKLEALHKLVGENPLKGRVGIGHTRWATHGEPSRRNAHPHTDCTQSLALVHNGIIENHEPLRRRLTEEGHCFVSETDTEVLAHLIESFHFQKGLSLTEAVRSTLAEIEGSYAFCVISKNEPDQFVAARNGSPLVVGLGDGENWVASDAPAILEHTQKVVFLEDYQMVVARKDGVRIMNKEGKPAPSRVTVLDWKVDEAQKHGYPHFMLKEIEDQPGVLRKLLRTVSLDGLAPSERILIQACGTSWHAALAGKFFFEELAGLPTEVEVSSEFRYRPLIRQPRTLVLSITQSGETIDTLMGLRRAKELGFKTLSICNVLGSTVARESGGVIYTHAGPEIGVASTKAYTAQLAALFLLALHWGKIRGTFSESRLNDLTQELNRLPEKMQRVVERRDEILKVARKYSEARDFLFLGRGIHYPSAFEGALKIKEIAYIHATGHPAGEMKHGPIALIDEKMPVVVLAPRSHVHEKMISNLQEVKARGGRVIAIATEGDEVIAKLAHDVFFLPDTEEILSPLLAALPLQYLAYFVAVLRGTDVDQPRNLAKSVTVE